MASRTPMYEHIEILHNNWIDPKKREMWIHGIDVACDTDGNADEPGVNFMMATRVIKNLHYFRNQSVTDRVIIHLHTCGGVWEEGMAIYDNIKMMPYPVTIVNHTHARSMSSIILQAADDRVMLPNSCFMFHKGQLMLSGHHTEVMTSAEWCKMLDRKMIDIYTEVLVKGKKFANTSEKLIRSHLNSIMSKKLDVYLTAEDAVDWGFADRVIHNWSEL